MRALGFVDNSVGWKGAAWAIWLCSLPSLKLDEPHCGTETVMYFNTYMLFWNILIHRIVVVTLCALDVEQM